MHDITPVNPTDVSFSPEERILNKAQSLLLDEGMQAMKMDALANELGMSKKTLYIHFPGKDAIIKAIITRITGGVTASMNALIEDKSLSFSETLKALHSLLSNRFRSIRPSMLRELERQCPEAYQILDNTRSRNIPMIFGHILGEGQKTGYVRPEIDHEFAAQAWLQMMRGLMQPDLADKLGMDYRQILDKALITFFWGVLTTKGQEELARINAEEPNPADS